MALLGAANSVHTRKWAVTLAERGHRVVVTSWVAADPIPGVDLRVAPYANSARRGSAGAVVRLVLTGWWMRREVRRTRPDVLHVHSLGMAGLFSLLIPRVGTRVVTPWGSELRVAARSKLRGSVVRAALRRADVVLPTSAAVTKELVDRYQVPVERTDTISWGVDDRFGEIRDDVRPDDVRRRHGIPLDATVLFSARSAGPVYRTEEILTAYDRAVAHRPDLHLVLLVGQRPAETSAAQAQRRCLDAAARLATARPGRVTVVDRTLTPVEVFTLMCASDVMISVPRWDQRSSTVLEAALAGCRLLLADLPAYHEMVSDGLTAEIVGEPLTDRLSEKLLTVRRSDAREQRQNRQFIETSESWSRQVGAVQRWYLALTGRQVATAVDTPA
ncbi:glycosyltransferase family 4 protein [Micromonospora echinofusca]|uniref:glycosyltransferase family 4 protein n=1 Tax=Micromonospora echinofusca TaxID=47858 RepID=UPI0033ECC2D1